MATRSCASMVTGDPPQFKLTKVDSIFFPNYSGENAANGNMEVTLELLLININ